MRINRNLIVVLITILTCFQLIIFFSAQTKTTEVTKSVINLEVKENKLIKDVDSLIVGLKNYKVISRVKDENSWIINIKLIGTKDEVIYDLKSLDKFIVKNYNINFKNDNYEVELELKNK